MSKKFLTDAEMDDALQASSPKADAAPKKRFLSDADMDKAQSFEMEKVKGPSIDGASKAIKQGIKDAPTEIFRGANPYDIITSAAENATDLLPGKGLITRAAANVPASVEYLYDKATDAPKRSYDEIYDENLKESVDGQEKQRKSSFLGEKLGTGLGILGSASIPAGNSAVARVGSNAAIASIDSATKGSGDIDLESAKNDGLKVGALTAGIEAIPVVGKGLSLAGKKAGNILFGVTEEATNRYLANPERMRSVINEGSDGLNRIKENVDDAYQSRVILPKDNAAENLLEARFDRSQAARDAQDYIANLKNVKPDAGLTGEVIQAVKKENERLSQLSGEAYNTLDGLQFQRQEVLDKIQSIKGGLLVDGKKPTIGDSAPAWGVLERLENAVKSNKKPDYDAILNQVDEVPGIAGRDLKKLIQQLDQESQAAYTTYGTRGAAKHIKGVRDEIDPILKSHQPYADAMVPTAEQAKLVSQLTKMFGDEKKARTALLASADPERGKDIRRLIENLDAKNGTNMLSQLDEYAKAQRVLKDPEVALATKREMMKPTEDALEAARNQSKEAREVERKFNKLGPNSSEGTIERVGRGNSIEGEKQLRELVGDDGLEGIKDYSLARDFVTDKTRGSKRTGAGAIAGGTVGSLFGGPIGAAFGTVAGGVAGATVDKYGGQVWQKLLDGSLKLGPVNKLAEEAAKKGPVAIRTLHKYLMEKSPEYRSALEDEERGNN